jgi:transcriptional regulator of met regulon
MTGPARIEFDIDILDDILCHAFLHLWTGRHFLYDASEF